MKRGRQDGQASILNSVGSNRAHRARRSSAHLLTFLVALVMVLATGCRFWGGGPLMKPLDRSAAGQVAGAVSDMTLPAGSAGGPAAGPGISAGAPAVGTVVPDLNPNAVAVPGDGGAGPAKVSMPGMKKAEPLKGRFIPEETISRRIQALSSDVVKDATVTLLGAGNKALASGLTDTSGHFELALSGFSPAEGGIYIVEVTKPLGSGGGAGTNAFRFRTVVQWSSGGWLSCTNTTVGPDPVINAYTTAVALELALDPGLSQSLAIGKVDVSGASPKLNSTPAFPNHPDSEIKALADDIAAYLTNNVDPTGAVNAIKPTLTGINPGAGYAGSLITISGQGFSPIAGGNTVSFNGTNATAFYLATNKTLIVAVPQGASTGNVTVATSRGGTSGNSMPFTVQTGLSVKVDTKGLDVPYYVAGAEITPQRGNRTVTLYPGSCQIVLATGQAASFVVTGAGTVDTSMSNGALTGTGSQVSFNTTSIAIKPGTYVGSYIISGGFMPSWVMGTVTATVMKGLQGYQLMAGPPHLFDVNSSGTVSPRGTWATGGAGTLTFNNIPLKIEANGFQSGWSISNVTPGSQTGTYTVYLPMDSKNYVLNVMGTTVAFDVDGSGDVDTHTNPYADGGSQVITLKMTNLKLWARGYTGMYSVTNVTGWVSGDQDMVVMKNFTYRLTFWPGNSYVSFSVAANGDLTVLSAGGQASVDVVGVAGNAQLEFKTKTITVADGGWKGNFGILYGQRAGSWTWVTSVSKKPNWVTTTEQFVLIHGMTNYYFLYFYPGTIDYYLNFNLDKFDNLTVAGWGAKTSDKVIKPISGSTITLNTLSVAFSSNGWQGYWGILYGISPYRGWSWLGSDSGDPNWFYNGQDRSHTLLLGLTDYYQIGFWPNWANYYLSMSVDGNGVITTTAVEDSKVKTNAVIIGPGAKLSLNTDTVSTKTDGFRGLSGFLYGDGPKTAWTWLRNTSGNGSWTTVDRSWKFVKGITNYYHLAFYPANTDYYYTFNFESGTLSPVGGGAKTTGDFYDTLAGNVIDYKVTPKVKVGLNGWNGYYGILYGTGPTMSWTWLADDVDRTTWSGYKMSRSYQFLQGLVDYYYFYFWPGNDYWINFNVDSAGGILARGSGAKADKSALVTGTNKLDINAVDVDINANGWTGNWGFLYGCGPKCNWTWLTTETGQPNWVQGSKSYSMVKGLLNYYYLYFWPGNGNYWLNLNLSSTGVLSASENPDVDKMVNQSVATYAVVSGRQTVKFNVGDLKVDPNNYTAYWGILYGCGQRCSWTWFPSADTGQENVANWVYPVGKTSPLRTWKVLRGIDNYYHFAFYPGRFEESADLQVDPTSGNVSVVSTGDWVTTDAFKTPVGNTLTLNTQRVEVNPNGWMGNHGFQYGGLYQNSDRTGPVTSGWSWLYNDRRDTCCWNADNLTQQADPNNWPAWYLVRGLKSYYIQLFYPGGKNFFRAIDVNANGSYSFPNDGADVTNSVYAASPANGALKFNTRQITIDRNGYTGYWGFQYGGNDGRTWLGNSRNFATAWLRGYTGDTTYDDVPYNLLLGLNNYYMFHFYPGTQYYTSLHYNATTQNFEFTTDAVGQNITPSAALIVSTDNVLRFGTRSMKITASSPPSGMTWVARHGDAGVYAAVINDIQNNSYDYLDGPSYPTRNWILVKGMKSYYTVYMSSATLPTGFGTNTDGTPTVSSVNVGGVNFSLTAQ